jgi:glycosyltransferase involved in cell wall biosynthesis
LCTTAPSEDYKSWSNIPYLLHKNLEKRGFIVKNYVLLELEPIKTIFNLPVRVINKYFNVGTTYFFVRTPLHFCITCMIGKWIQYTSDKSDVMLVQGFSYPINNRYNRQIILGDWPSEYLFEKFLKRLPNRLERSSIERENAVIEAADAIVTLFPHVREYMLQRYKNKNIYYLGNVVNVDDDISVPEDILNIKQRSNRLLFIGQPFYLTGAKELIEAVRIMRAEGIDVEVDIIGIPQKLLGVEYGWLKVHGYLDKGKVSEKKRYYEIVLAAKVFVNTTPGWSGFQAILESLYFGNPIVVRPNEAISSYFANLSDICYLWDEDKIRLDLLLESIFNSPNKYNRMSEAARGAVKFSTWDRFIDKLIELIKIR